MKREYIDILRFAREHRGDDPLKLLLQQKRYSGIDLRLVVQQLEGQRQASAKWPTLAACADYWYPPRLNREQSSSETAARYKARLFAALGGGTLADLTGGMGVDAYFLSQEAARADYFELDAELTAIAEHNFSALGAEHIVCHSGDSLAQLPAADLLFIDPARRDTRGRRVAAFEDCTPNLLESLPRLLASCRHLMVKASPMIDLRLALGQLAAAREAHIVAVGGECKEVLFVLDGGPAAGRPQECRIRCANLWHSGAEDFFDFTLTEEAAAVPTFATAMGRYLYEPNAALMKGGCHNLVSERFGLGKLARNTHLYTSDTLLDSFPGRRFEVLSEAPLNAKDIRRLLPEGKAHVTARNYPMPAAELQQKLKLHEGGALTIVAATLGSRPMGWLCRQL